MHWTALTGRREIVELLIAKGADVNAKNDGGGTPLDGAITNYQTETADLLREHGGKHGVINGAAAGGDIEAVKEFLDAGVDVNATDGIRRTPLHRAAMEGHKEIVELLIAKGADVNATSVFGQTPLSEAIERRRIEIVELLIAAGADVNAKYSETGRTPLHDAAINGRKEIAELLIANGADVNAKDRGGSTPLHYAKTKEIAELLISKGADVNAKKDDGVTPLHFAAREGHKEIVELLIANGADVYAKGGGFTPLHYAAWNGHKEVAELLIENGAEVNAKDNYGRTPLDLASGATAELLRTHGGMTGEELKALMPRLVQHGRFAFSFDAGKDKSYTVEATGDLLKWNRVETFQGTGSAVEFTDTREALFEKQYYRVKTQQ